ncbi:uncharacterized RING finger protein C548.05c-like [Telopea speciosissima]|uniref:uncharacterized RING finger protein C548.05c-like n=1 Tax=Telopea speciosissima TaxID=54955 RepID=UPI001CC3607A|nr:uncharacterized RING finger protein C548.05c-like [Telopea speciosissima]
MSTRGLRRPLKGYVRDFRRRKMVLNVDLNDTPPAEGRDLEEISTGTGSQGGQTSVQGWALVPAATIDVDAIDDDVVISSPRSFAEARNNSRRNHGVTVVLDDESDINQRNSGDLINSLSLNGHNKRRRVSPNQTIINCELYINLDGSNNAKNELKSPEPPVPPPPMEPTFSCPVCMEKLVEETSTKCGHIFCKRCIKVAITAQHKCPTCRRRLTMKDIIRIYLPAAN